MSDYWKEHFNSNALKFPDSPLKQVETTVYGREIDKEQFEMLVQAIRSNLDLQPSDVVADLCCGNGVITQVIAQQCQQLYGVDFSENLIANARTLHAAPNINYTVSNVSTLPEVFFQKPAKGYMCYAVQHLSPKDLHTLLSHIAQQPQWRSFFISGIPNADKLTAFYDTDEKMAFYRKKEAAGEPHLGKWWRQSELQTLVESVGLHAQCIPQPAALFSAHYRFDCLIERA
jgi:hypothetical protein